MPNRKYTLSSIGAPGGGGVPCAGGGGTGAPIIVNVFKTKQETTPIFNALSFIW